MRPEEEVGTLLLQHGLTLVTAESCTGGLLGHRITNVSGSSDYYLGGVVSYSNDLKERLLGVRHETLVAHGAVSEETAREMAQGARRQMGGDVALAVTGIAGPTGGTPEKPVGLVYIALAAPGADACERYVWQGDRVSNKEQSAEAALQMALAYLRGVPAPADRAGKRTEAEEYLPAFLDEPVNVEVRIRRDGSALPVSFGWQSRQYRIESWGREGDEGSGGHYYLVQTAGAETWELYLNRETGRWTVRRHWGRAPQRA